ncbi:DUF983 domain-containing protein [Tianweitania sp. BSSL-BM11]|uniref:DUF983 domain-containing protein n=1 Tax=Tianweitania aestuarii TaxID=2814886 RepID=A0ABS5RWC2_9HYPH|nr:DUF983 domain-containing protein [Tianweitania aestuarii]MBS9720494.1 DUF983 domain-containing protein [Tianweitania aestuarii]
MQDDSEFTSGTSARPARPLIPAMWRGFRSRCPACGEGKLFRAFVKVNDSCPACGEAFHHHRADDLPAYLVVFIVGHLVVGAFMGVETLGDLALWQHLAIWVPLTVIACIALLQPIKGAVVGLQWALYMHGFSGHEDELDHHPELEPAEGAVR